MGYVFLQNAGTKLMWFKVIWLCYATLAEAQCLMENKEVPLLLAAVCLLAVC